ncbi:hypothetical protein BN946_scf185001.g29 [Trametes cinnabarina]|uniref:UvrD-like helicase ATP-binding domain-containing protein n=1 Tax=Pycnoporus cinnabarinus TaxID=5643 RepID=A0A060SKQ9_PYCCI|nr:hypothetical protein BN946_scf185001.g29 [Trametes cinnabarina]
MAQSRVRTASATSRLRGRSVSDAVSVLLDAKLLEDELAIETALRALESHLADPATALSSLVQKLLSTPHCLEFVLSDLASDEPPFLRAHHYSVELAAPLLIALTKLKTQCGDEVDSLVDAEDDDDDEFAGAFFVVKKKGKHKRKQSKRANRGPPVDTKVISDYSGYVPRTVEEVSRMMLNVFERQRTILEDYLKMFRLPHLAPLIRNTYIPRPASTTEAQVATTTSTETDVLAEAENDEAPPAYPSVQPMRAALYFDSADGFGQWRILISTRADRNLRQARNKNPDLFEIIIKKIKELSRGQFSEDNQKRLSGLNVEIPIYEAKMTGDTRLVYQVDLLRIFGIYTHAQLDRRFWDCMSRQLERKGAEYRKRCKFRNSPLVPGDYVVLPASWPAPAEPSTLEPPPVLSDLRKEYMEEMHSLLVLEKFVTFSQALLNSILADQDVAHVFDVSPHEKKIIEHPSSCFVLGRSGTGKTTTMLFKMLGIERSWEGCKESLPKPRQLFVTQSRVLAEKVEEYFAKLHDSLKSAHRTTDEIAELSAQKKAKQDQGLVDWDEEVYWRGDLPKRYGELRDEHFPMFLTYDHVCRLLEAEFHHSSYGKLKEVAVAKAMHDVLALKDPQAEDGSTSNDYMQQRRTSFVSYNTFLEAYWPQLAQKGLALVFGEFMVIKGSEQALKQPKGYLDKESYCKLSHRTQSTFASQRDNIYKLFEVYLKRKKERGDYDAADRTHALINCLKTMGVPGQEVDFLYVDEAQDNLLIDAVVLRKLCRNPHGMFWAGDTAQTISIGSSFRFNDLKAFLYRYEEATAPDTAKRVQPESFHLAVNYRSHAGIVDCAYSVIELITKFWPNAIDSLGRETGMVEGIKPVFFSGWDQNNVRYEQFLFGETGSHIEFGAQQCILVRDEAARQRLRAQVGDIGLIMTLYESKGLEFNDVLLFNFFEDSTADISQWRVVLNALPQDQRRAHPAPTFDETRHSGICRELKFLYVAITRARKNLWIADCSDKGEPMRNLIQNCDPSTGVPQLAATSSAEDWAKMALELFNNRRYMQAMHCYERAGLVREKAVSNAYYLREVARTTSAHKGDTAARTLAFITAAKAFISSAQDAVKEKRAYYRIAAECYVQASDDYRAAQAYQDAAEFTLAAQHYRKAGKFDKAVEVVKLHKGQVAENVAESILEVSRLYFLRENSILKARELFDTDEGMLEYMDDYGLDMARAAFLEKLGRYEDAAEYHLSEGNVFEAIRLLTINRSDDRLVRRAMQCLLDGLWRRLPLGTAVTEALLKADTTLAKLLQLADNFRDQNEENDLRSEVSMFRAIARRNTVDLRTLAKAFQARGNVAAVFLCLDHVFSAQMLPHNASLSDVSETLETFRQYAVMLQQFATSGAFCDNAVVRKLLAIQESSDDLFLVPKDSFLTKQMSPRLTPSARILDSGTSVPRWELERLLDFVLRNRLIHRIQEENTTLSRVRALQPCLNYVVYRQCNRVECPRHHGSVENYDAAAYNNRIRVVLQQVLIYQILHSYENAKERARQQRFWLRHLYEALFPEYYKLGSYQALDPKSIPELERGFQIVDVWVRDLLYGLDASRTADSGTPFLVALMRATRTSFTCGNKEIMEYISRLPCVAAARPEHLLRGPDKAYIVLDFVSFMQNTDPPALDRGILFLNHVLENHIPVDIGVLCGFMEHLCGSFLLCIRGRATTGTLHNLTLPKSWLMCLVPNYATLMTRDSELWWQFKTHLKDLLEQIYEGCPWLLYEGGYNLRSFELRNDIHRAISLVRQPGRTFHPLIDKYAGLRFTLFCKKAHPATSVSDTTLDEMIHLHHGSYLIPRTSIRYLRRVVFNRVEDIPWLLKTGGSSLSAGGLRAEAAPFVPTRIAAETGEEERADEEDDAEEPMNDINVEDEEGLQRAVNVDDIAQAIDAKQANFAPALPTAEEIAAAQKIASAYQSHLARLSLRKPKPKEEKKRRVFTAFLTESAGMAWPHRYYRLLYTGPIPHLYIVAEGIKDHLYEAKNNAKKRLNIVKHLELENIQSTLTQTTRLFKEAEKLYKALAPAADVHKARDLDALKEYALQVEALMRGIPPSESEKWEQDMFIARKGIIEEKKPPKVQPKPELNVEDDLMDGREGVNEFSW